MKLAVALVVMLSGGCANQWANRGALVASTASIACDGGSTLWATSRGSREVGMARSLLGEHPDQTAVIGYFGMAAAVNAFVWLATPNDWRVAPSLAVISAEAVTITGNGMRGSSWCGIR